MPLCILIKARSHNLPRLILSRWGSETWKHQLQFTERSLATCNSYCYRQHYLQSNSKNVRTSGCDNFKLYDLILAFCNLEYSRIIACHLHLNLLESESPSGKCPDLRTVAASNNKGHTPRSLYYCLFAPRIYSPFLRAHYVRREPRIPAQRQRSGCNKLYATPKLSHIYFSFSQSEPYKGLGHRTESRIWTEKNSCKWE